MSQALRIILVSQVIRASLSTLNLVNLKAPQYECLNGKNPTALTPKQTLIEFSKGKCSPLLIAPALFSTRIIIQIDCPTLKAENAEIFTLCGWNSCSKKFYEFWKSVPDKEYHMWVPDFFSPLSIFQIHERKNFCWVKFASLLVDFNKPIENGIIEQKGFSIKIYGQTEKSVGLSYCGDRSNEDLLNNMWFELKTTRYVKLFHQKLRDMGYVPGLTYQTLPYDFRLSYRANQFKKIFRSNLVRLNMLTRKKVVIIGHSLGNLNIYSQLMDLEMTDKKKLIKNWIAVASALGGSTDAMKSLVGGDATYIFLKGMVGIHYHAEIEALQRIISIYELLPYNPFESNKNEAWFQAFKNRMLYEDGKNKYEDSGFKFLPRLEEKCTPDNFISYTTECRLGLTDYNQTTVVQILQDQYTINQVEEMLTKYKLTDVALDFYKYTKDEKMARFDNPGVPIIAINLRTGNSISKYTYKTDVREYLHNHKFPYPEVEYGYGDGVISSTIQFAWYLKWAFEYDKGVKDSEPVKFVDMCSTYKIKYDVYDTKDSDKPYEIKDNEFFGIECDCILDRRTNDCNHPNVLSDTKVHDLIFNALKANEISYSDDYERFVQSLDDNDLNKMVTTCPQINSDELNALSSLLSYAVDVREI